MFHSGYRPRVRKCYWSSLKPLSAKILNERFSPKKVQFLKVFDLRVIICTWILINFSLQFKVPLINV